MKAADWITQSFKKVLPTPFTIAVVLTVVTFVLAAVFGHFDSSSETSHVIQLLGFWEAGLWDSSLLVFAFQMMLMLLLGHVMALSEPIKNTINAFVQFGNTTAKAAALVGFTTMLVGLFNWGLGLVFGAVFARKIADLARERGIQLNYPLVGAAGYAGLLVWHGGLSGSSLIKVAESGHLKGLVGDAERAATLPDALDLSATVFSSMNITASILVVCAITAVLYLLGKSAKPTSIQVKHTFTQRQEDLEVKGAAHLDHSSWVGAAVGGLIVLYTVYLMAVKYGFLPFFNPNNINLLLLGLGLVMHRSIRNFLWAIDQAIGGVSGILIQFPIYFGIMGIMRESGLVADMSAFFVEISNATTYPILTFVSAAIVNVFVPSGGGQWAIQGPIIIQAAQDLNLPLSKCILAMAYGDQLTNMLQPFWALPLLGITGLKAKEILPYTLIMMVVAALVFLSILLIF